jgi:VCBS repeat-containing protein
MDWKRVFVLALVLLVGSSIAAAQDKWLHVRVEETGEDEESVKVNVPLSLIGTVLPMIETNELQNGRVKLEDDLELTVPQIREIWQTLKTQGDYEMASIQNKDVNLRISMEGNTIFVRTADGSAEKISVTVPGEVMDALLSGSENELNVKAAVEALSQHASGDLVTVEDGSSLVRIWVDNSSTSE